MALERIRQENQASTSKLWAYLGNGYDILTALGYDYIPTDHNPIYTALAALAPFSEAVIQDLIAQGFLTEQDAADLSAAQSAGAELAPKLKAILWNSGKPNKSAIIRAYLICQTACLNTVNGPMRNGYLATARIRWYFSKLPFAMGFKLFAQLFESALIDSADVVKLNSRDEERDARQEGATKIVYKVNWTKEREAALAEELGRTPNVHTWPKADGGWVRTYAQALSAGLAELVREGLTYEELWVRDASRDYTSFNGLIPGFYGILAIEKEGEYEHFAPLCRSLGMPMLLAMGGNNAFSGVEYIINQHLRDWNGQLRVSPDNPLHLFVISDFDWAGFQPVCEAAYEQFKRYLGDSVVLHRVGLNADQLAHYDRSIVLAGYKFKHNKNAAYAEWAQEYGVWVDEDTCYGIEMEALDPIEYAPFLIAAIVEACGGDDALKEALSKMAEPNWYDVQRKIEEAQVARSRLYRLLEQLERWGGETRHERVARPVEEFVDTHLEGSAYWECSCGEKYVHDPALLELCPHCGEYYVHDATFRQSREGGYVYVCPCGYEYEGEPTERLICPECGDRLEDAEPGPAFKKAEHVRENIEKILEESRGDIDLDDFQKHAERGGYGAWAPANSAKATEAARDIFEQDYDEALTLVVNGIDERAAQLIRDLEAAYYDLSDWNLVDPD